VSRLGVERSGHVKPAIPAADVSGVNGDLTDLPPVPIRRGFVVALVATVTIVVMPFGIAVLLDDPDGVSIEPISRAAGALAIVVSPIVALVAGFRRGLAARMALVPASGIASIACLALLFVVTSIEGPMQATLAGAVAGAALNVAARVGSRTKDVPTRPDIPR
jgi:hypothetical protein